MKEVSQILSDKELKDESFKIVVNSLLDETKEDWMRKLWDEIQEANANHEDKGKAPLIELDLDKPQANLVFNLDIAWLSLLILVQAKPLP